MNRLLKMAWRNVWRNGRRTMIALIAIALGLALMLFFDGLVGGAKQAIYGNVVRLQGGNLQIHAPGYREKAGQMPLYALEDAGVAVQAALSQPQVIAAARRINTSGMVSTREGTMPVVISGIEPGQETAISLVAENMARGRYLRDEDEDVLLIGKGLARELAIDVGDRVTLVGRATHQQMRRRTMTIVGIYDLGMEVIEKRAVYLSLQEAQTLFDLRNEATEVAVYLERIGQEPAVVESLQASLPGYEVDAWDTLDPTVKDGLEINDQMMGFFGFVILLIAGVGILNLMLMAVFERTREIGILAAMGMKRRETVALFLLEGMLIGLLGALAGALLGGLINVYMGRVGMPWTARDYSDLTAMMGERIYFSLTPGKALGRALAAAVIASLASLYPAWQASRREPAEALHYV
jgi:ABC-type lipoprotein release transport system permease subunit